jgi:hypothetical protein
MFQFFGKFENFPDSKFPTFSFFKISNNDILISKCTFFNEEKCKTKTSVAKLFLYVFSSMFEIRFHFNFKICMVSSFECCLDFDLCFGCQLLCCIFKFYFIIFVNFISNIIWIINFCFLSVFETAILKIFTGNRYEGIIYRILEGGKELELKFESRFHERYVDGVPVDVHFQVSRGGFKRAHHAIDRAFENQAGPVLFPTHVRSHFFFSKKRKFRRRRLNIDIEFSKICWKRYLDWSENGMSRI